jgi:hypothetical protein
MPHPLEKEYPFIQWREPIAVASIDDPSTTHYACRICIGEAGLRGNEIPDLPTDPEEVRKHIAEVHTESEVA